MKNVKLIQILTEQTQELKIEYVQKTKEWAEKNYAYCSKILKRTSQEWCDHFNIKSKIHNPGTSIEFVGFPTDFYNTSAAYTMSKEKKKASAVVRQGYDFYLSEIEKNAIIHYENSINKLAYRISEKGLNEDKIEIKTARVGRNLETFLTDGEKKVRAFTVLAWGEVNQPHYRYLIK